MRTINTAVSRAMATFLCASETDFRQSQPHQLSCPAPPPLLQPTTAAVLPLRDENHLKSYLLQPAQRRALLHAQGGRLAEAPAGARGLEPLLQVGRIPVMCTFVSRGQRFASLAWPMAPVTQPACLPVCLPSNSLTVPIRLSLQDRSFICLHFHLDQHGQLHPVAAVEASSSSGGAAAGSAGSGGGSRSSSTDGGGRQYSLEQSNVQLGVMVRKGVGGTCPLR